MVCDLNMSVLLCIHIISFVSSVLYLAVTCSFDPVVFTTAQTISIFSVQVL